MTLTVFRAGNSEVITIPKELREKFGWKIGTKVDVQLINNGLAIRSIDKKQKISAEFDHWLKRTAKKYGPALRELAKK